MSYFKNIHSRLFIYYEAASKNIWTSHQQILKELGFIGVASYGGLGHVPPPRLPTVWSVDVCLLLRCFRFNKTQTHVDVVSHFTREYTGLELCHRLLHEFHNIFICVTIKLFSLSFVPPLAPNPGDATARIV